MVTPPDLTAMHKQKNQQQNEVLLSKKCETLEYIKNKPKDVLYQVDSHQYIFNQSIQSFEQFDPIALTQPPIKYHCIQPIAQHITDNQWQTKDEEDHRSPQKNNAPLGDPNELFISTATNNEPSPNFSEGKQANTGNNLAVDFNDENNEFSNDEEHSPTRQDLIDIESNAIIGDDILFAESLASDTSTNSDIDEDDKNNLIDVLYDLNQNNEFYDDEYEVITDGEKTKSEISAGLALELYNKHGLSGNDLDLLSDLLTESPWTQTQHAIERGLLTGLSVNEICLASDIKKMWSERFDYMIQFYETSNHYDYSSQPSKSILSWNEAYKIIKKFGKEPTIQEIEMFFDESYDEWYNSQTLRKIFKNYLSFLMHLATKEVDFTWFVPNFSVIKGREDMVFYPNVFKLERYIQDFLKNRRLI